jgi:PAS domain S-box-containing protein
MADSDSHLTQRWDLAERSAGFGIWDLDIQRGTVQYSAEWKALLGYPATDEADSTEVWRSRVHPDDLPAMVQALGDHVAGLQPAYAHEFRLQAADGGYLWVLSRGRVVAHDPDGAPLRAVGTLIDLTHRRQQEAQRLAHERAETAQGVQAELMSRMSHELRTPLNAVLGFAQLLGARIGHDNLDEQRRYVAHIEEAGWQLLRMVDDVLALSDLQAGSLQVQAQQVDLCELVRSALENHQAIAIRHQLTLTAAPLPLRAPVMADARRLQQVLSNLLSNAVKYNRPGGTVKLGLRFHDTAWVLWVTDSGVGMSAAQVAHLFEPFNRLGRRSTGAEGVGVGLVLARSLLAMMGGTLAVQSTEGQGSTFEISLPAGTDQT